MPNFRVHVKGISLLFYQSPVWNVIFPCDGDHQVEFAFNSTSVSSLWERRRAKKVIFPVPGPTPQDHVDSTFPTLFNMAAPYAHETVPPGQPNAGRPNLEFHQPFPPPNRDILWLQIPNSTISCVNPSPQNYYVQDVTKHSGSRVIILPPRAREVFVDFDVSGSIALTQTDLRDSGYTRPLHPAMPSIPAPSSGQHLLTFDNDCEPNCPDENDFKNFYDLILDNNSNPAKRRRFAAGQVIPWPPPPSLTITSTYGNCDPVVVDPSPSGP